MTGQLGYELHGRYVLVDVGRIATATTDALVTMVACTSKEVEHDHVFEVEFVSENVKEPLLGDISGRTRRPAFGRWDKLSTSELT